jgi:hypothetical protein
VIAGRSTWAATPQSRDLGVLAAGTLLIALGLVVGIGAAPFSYDDAWITYRYAYNLAAGDGFVYNPGERMFGTTAPGYALLVGLLSLPKPAWVPQVSAGLNVVALTAASLALYVFGVRVRSGLAGFVAGAVFAVNPLALDTFGGEMVPQAALALWGLTAVALERPELAAVFGVGAAMTRPDGLLALIVILGWQGWRDRRVPWRPIIVAGIGLTVWFGGLWLYFGAPLPDTLAVKQAQRLSGLWRSLGTDLVIWILSLSAFPTPFMGARFIPGFTTFLALAVAGLLVLPFRRTWWPLAAWPILVLLAYRQMRLPFYHWYAVPPLVLMAMTAGLACEVAAGGVTALIARLRAGQDRRRSASTVTVVVGALVVAAVGAPMSSRALATRAWFPGPGERAYIDIGHWLARETPLGATVGYLEVGFIGYYARRHIIDPFGLVTPGGGAGIARRDFLYAYRTRRPDFILFHPAYFPKQLGPLVEQDWFKAEYSAVATLKSPFGVPITVYRRHGSGETP